jgi:hypothetical protein
MLTQRISLCLGNPKEISFGSVPGFHRNSWTELLGHTPKEKTIIPTPMSVIEGDGEGGLGSQAVDKVQLCELITKLPVDYIPGIVGIVQDREPKAITLSGDSCDFDLSQLKADTLIALRDFVRKATSIKNNGSSRVSLSIVPPEAAVSRGENVLDRLLPPPSSTEPAPLKRSRSRGSGVAGPTASPSKPAKRPAVDSLPPPPPPITAPTLSTLGSGSFLQSCLDNEPPWLPPPGTAGLSSTPSFSAFLPPLESLDSGFLNDFASIPSYHPALSTSIPSLGVVAECSNTWKCPVCTLDNPDVATTCTLCGKTRPSSSRVQSTARYVVSIKKIDETSGVDAPNSANTAAQVPSSSTGPENAAPPLLYGVDGAGTGKIVVPPLQRGAHGRVADPAAPKKPPGPYKCTWPDCGKSFGYRSNLYVHMRTHTRDAKYGSTAVVLWVFGGCFAELTVPVVGFVCVLGTRVATQGATANFCICNQRRSMSSRTRA